MALDGIYLSLLRKEFDPLIDGRVDKIHQPSREELIMTIRTKEGAQKLMFSTGAGSARVHITTADIENPKTPPMFCMLMRKHLAGGRLTAIRQDGFERILFFDFEATNEMGDRVNLTLAAEIMGRRSNLILYREDGRIIDSIKRVGQEMSSVRMVLPGAQYTLPPREQRLNLMECTKEEFLAKIAENPTAELSKAIMKTLEGISPVFAWLTHGPLVGDVVAVKCAISQDDFEGGKNFSETVSQALCACIKLLGKDYLEVKSNAVKSSDGCFIYDMITMKYLRALATIEIGTTVDVENELAIIGTRGRITVPGDWWNTGYFEAKIEGQEFLKRYSFNFEGNGLRYLLQELVIMIRDRRTECTRFFYEESETLAELLIIINQRG